MPLLKQRTTRVGLRNETSDIPEAEFGAVTTGGKGEIPIQGGTIDTAPTMKNYLSLVFDLAVDGTGTGPSEEEVSKSYRRESALVRPVTDPEDGIVDQVWGQLYRIFPDLERLPEDYFDRILEERRRRR